MPLPALAHFTCTNAQEDAATPNKSEGLTQKMCTAFTVRKEAKTASASHPRPQRDATLVEIASLLVARHELQASARIVNKDRRGASEYTVRVLLDPSPPAFSQVTGGFVLRWRPWLCPGVRACCRQRCRPSRRSGAARQLLGRRRLRTLHWAHDRSRGSTPSARRGAGRPTARRHRLISCATSRTAYTNWCP